eukprot:gnl/TRDRNA2_/TRDRNA2_93534_c0_seq2.p1 gnl/TRDRNA2_/TRDRNA2_93534_c0~~gnl/TRDRNA2_/TRDRNA2_93534_c0_seq2.p1  ORF type:complete len:285 (-),score=43.11 gnl/TRDRNA2_/TRDRNA2_93534_c0_seq2:549-1403(-)
MEGFARTSLLHTIQGGHLYDDAVKRMSKINAAVEELPWVYMKLNGWILELWQCDRYSTLHQVAHETPVAWYDCRRIVDMKCNKSKCQEASDCSYELQIIYANGVFKLRFPLLAEIHAWHSKLIGLARANLLFRGGKPLELLDAFWVDILKNEAERMHNASYRMKDVFREMDVNKNGSISSGQCASLCMQSFEHRRMFLKEHDMRCHEMEGTLNSSTMKLLNEYEHRMGSYVEIHNWFLASTAVAGELKLLEFQALVSQCIFPDEMIDLEREVWCSPATAAKPFR